MWAEAISQMVIFSLTDDIILLTTATGSNWTNVDIQLQSYTVKYKVIVACK